MENNDLSIFKNFSEASEKFSGIINKFIQPDALDLAIIDGHKQIIEKALNGKSVNIDAIDFLCGYKKLIKQQKRCKNIADKAKQFIENSAQTEKITEDWLEFFFDKARLVVNEDMQLIWAKLLAEEANNPGSINPSLLHAISIMRYDEAEFFCNICRFALKEFKKDDIHLLIFISTNRVAYSDSNITPSKLKALERLGLIECDFDKEYIFTGKKIFSSGNRVITVYGDPENNKKIKAGNVKFTYDGATLYSLIDSNYKKYRTDIFNFTISKFKKRNCNVILNDKGNV